MYLLNPYVAIWGINLPPRRTSSEATIVDHIPWLPLASGDCQCREKLSPAHIYCVNTAPIVANGSQGMWSTIVASGSKRVNDMGHTRCLTYVTGGKLRLLGFLNMHVNWSGVFQMNMDRRLGAISTTDCYRVLDRYTPYTLNRFPKMPIQRFWLRSITEHWRRRGGAIGGRERLQSKSWDHCNYINNLFPVH